MAKFVCSVCGYVHEGDTCLLYTSVFIVVGCEGGFSEDEVIQLEEVGFHRVSLGARILRAETAALSLLACISFFYEMAGDHHENTGTTGK